MWVGIALLLNLTIYFVVTPLLIYYLGPTGMQIAGALKIAGIGSFMMMVSRTPSGETLHAKSVLLLMRMTAKRERP